MRLSCVRLRQAEPVLEASQWLRSQRAKINYDKNLIHVTSNELCDDALNILKPTLPPPHTCNIIDLNPGPCLWSQKLHDLLKPRRHVLVEPLQKVFADRIQPLLDQPNSRYRSAPDLKSAFDEKNGLLSEDIYSFRKDVKASDNPELSFNENLIITANLSGKAKKVVGFTGSMAKRFLHQYYGGFWVNEDFMHRYGHVRLLAWVGEDARRSIMPTNVNDRTKQSMQLETICTLDQIAGPSQFHGLHVIKQRFYDLDVENQKEMRETQKRLHIDIPSERNQPDPVPPFLSLKPFVSEIRKHKDLYPFHQVYIKKLLELEDYIATTTPDWYADYQSEEETLNLSERQSRPRRKLNAEQGAFRFAVTQLRTRYRSYDKVKDFIWEQRALFQKFKRAFTQTLFPSKPDSVAGDQPTKTTKKLIKEDKLMAERLSDMKADDKRFISRVLDDYRCYDSEPRALAWNRRRHEPLLVQDTEFIPQQPLTLFDFKPKSDVISKLDTLDKQVCYNYICTSLMMHPADTVEQAIRRIIPVRYEEFIEAVPDLHNPVRGGWYDLNMIRIRALHHDLFLAIALAFHDWPGRPSISKLMMVHQTVFDHESRPN